ncbi:2,3-dihydroxybiphenyl 1,2-dioxygenase [Rhodococcus wratislaviensis]|uniref:2,3-dihydroxybiphenyl 1,2-dioxygenase n=1 Tax=Rhodococcus wratislaviensis TaxID=44752 RepID=A0A402CL33_RHOWR|nr:VOC family protein [Rhodococcus wratislaviensis]GCE44255.1 2,3-dihydroxybiphenyl 1,2-dioxygenase [Rhodococcus wratislaviensis]
MDSLKLQHIMLEVEDLDMVGSALDRAQAADVVPIGLGRHGNDEMLSFHTTAPSGLLIEYGCGDKTIDNSTHKISIYTSGTTWGHRSLSGEAIDH